MKTGSHWMSSMSTLKYITEAFLPIVNFRRYKAFDNTAIREFYWLLRAPVIGA
jgi:hypothetical protein